MSYFCYFEVHYLRSGCAFHRELGVLLLGQGFGCTQAFHRELGVLYGRRWALLRFPPFFACDDSNAALGYEPAPKVLLHRVVQRACEGGRAREQPQLQG